MQHSASEIEKLMDLTSFSVRFFKQEQEETEGLMDLEDDSEVQRKLERLMLMNLNQNYSLVKSEFTAPLEVIYGYVKVAKPTEVMSQVGLEVIHKLALGQASLNQRGYCLKIIMKLVRQ